MMQKLVRKKEPWLNFLPKAILVTLLIISSFYWFNQNYYIAYDPQEIKCIPGTTFYLVDKNDKTVIRDNIYVFSAKNMNVKFKDGTPILKIARGMPFDEVAVENDYRVTINGKELFQFLPHAEKLGKKPDDFVRKKTLKKDEYWFFGTNPLSFDSRYWGSVKQNQIIGRAYPLF